MAQSEFCGQGGAISPTPTHQNLQGKLFRDQARGYPQAIAEGSPRGPPIQQLDSTPTLERGPPSYSWATPSLSAASFPRHPPPLRVLRGLKGVGVLPRKAQLPLGLTRGCGRRTVLTRPSPHPILFKKGLGALGN